MEEEEEYVMVLKKLQGLAMPLVLVMEQLEEFLEQGK